MQAFAAVSQAHEVLLERCRQAADRMAEASRTPPSGSVPFQPAGNTLFRLVLQVAYLVALTDEVQLCRPAVLFF